MLRSDTTGVSLCTRLSGVSLALLSIAVLAACDPLAQGDAPLAIQRVDGNFRLAVCTRLVLESVLVEERGDRGDDGSGWMTIWDAIEGEIPLTAVSVLDAGQPPQEMDVTSWLTVRNVVGDEISVLLVGVDDSVVTTSFIIPEGGLPSDAWMHHDGTLTSDPCPQSPENKE